MELYGFPVTLSTTAQPTVPVVSYIVLFGAVVHQGVDQHSLPMSFTAESAVTAVTTIALLVFLGAVVSQEVE